MTIRFMIAYLGIFLLICSSAFQAIHATPLAPVPNKYNSSNPSNNSPQSNSTSSLSLQRQTQPLNFAQYYHPPKVIGIYPSVPSYVLPLKLGQISNVRNLSAVVSMSNSSMDLLKKNGFTVVTNPFYQQEENIVAPYQTLHDQQVPLFITSDSLLHIYHILLDQTLKQVEEKQFYDSIWNISKQLLADSIQAYNFNNNSSTTNNPELRKAAKLDAAYFAVGLSLLQPKSYQVQASSTNGTLSPSTSSFPIPNSTGYNNGKDFTKGDLLKYSFVVPAFVKETVAKELALIAKHSGFSNSSIFQYPLDYSQFVPRSHYTSSQKLQNYFKGLTWYGTTSFLIKDKIQTIAASIIASEFAQSKQLRDTWSKIYQVTAFYVGVSDDLGPNQYITALKNIFNASSSFSSPPSPQSIMSDLSKLSNEGNYTKLKIELAKVQSPKIYGGTTQCIFAPPFTSEKVKKCLESTAGMHLMGHRYTPDSFIFSNLSGPLFEYKGNISNSGSHSQPQPFTLIRTESGHLIRGFPRGLDILSVLLGSTDAKEIISKTGDSNYTKYDNTASILKQQFDRITPNDWYKSLYWSWLYALKPLVNQGYTNNSLAHYPTFMQTRAWQDKELTTALGSWSQLRHDTILYVKQSYSSMVTSAAKSLPPPLIIGYVEPVPEFYNRLLVLTNMTISGLSAMNVLTQDSNSSLMSLQGILQRLVSISQNELQNKNLTQADYDFINNFGDSLGSILGPNMVDQSTKTTIIADVHTDSNSGQVLEEGTGYVKLIVVAYRIPDGRILVGAGPLLSYYEFKQPMNNRLTDESWRILLSSTNPPKEQEWMHSFAAFNVTGSSMGIAATTTPSQPDCSTNRNKPACQTQPEQHQPPSPPR